MNLPQRNQTLEKFGNEFQRNLIKALITDKRFFDDIHEILLPEYFSSIANYNIYRVIVDYNQQFKDVPDAVVLKILLEQLKDDKVKEVCLFEFSLIENSNINLNYFKEASSKFCKNQKIRKAIEASVDLLSIDDYEKIRKLVIDATLFETKKDLGHFYENLDERFKNSRKFHKTGYPALDAIIAGWGFGELSIVAGKPSVGKTFFLINFLKKSMDAGLNCLYYTLELNDKIIGKRLDSTICGISINDLDKRETEAKEIINKYLEKNNNRAIIKSYPTKKASVVTLENHIDSLMRIENFKPDIIYVDYADLLRPLRNSEKRFELASVYEDLRAMATELDLPVVSATQINRTGADASYVTMEFLAEAYEKAAISDIILGATRKLSGEDMNFGNLFIAKNRPAGRDGQTLPIIYQTSKAYIELPYTEDILQDLTLGKISNVAAKYFTENNVEINTIGKPKTSPNFMNTINKMLKEN